MITTRRKLLATAALSALPFPARAARDFVDSAGRRIQIPDRIQKVFGAGGPAAIAIYSLRPDVLAGWPRPPYPEERPYIAPVARDLPEVGLITGRGDTLNLENLLRAAPDLIIDFGSVRDTYVSLAERVQERSRIPYALIDGRFESTPKALRMLGDLLDARARAEELAAYAENLFTRVDKLLATKPESQRPRVYLARGPNGLETGLKGSINTEIIERAGGQNVAVSNDGRRGIANISPEQLLLWDPNIVITWDRIFFANLAQKKDPLWQNIRAVREGRVYLAPTAPFGWIDRPPSLNRLIGLAWLAHVLHGADFPLDIADEARRFYRLFYQVDMSEAQLSNLLAWADGRPPALVRPR
ncbi:MAG: hypothetical protein RL735_1888 [Pseudomonadota bacterium]